MPEFVHLHVHTTYSMLDGACQIVPLVKRVKALGMRACAITDHGNMFGVKAFYDACRHEGIKPILGCETYVATEPHTGRTCRSGHHLILLAKNLTGYHNLVRLISCAHMEGFYYSPRIDKELLERYHEGLIVSSACVAGEIPQLILDGHLDRAEETAAWFKNIFGDDYYFEIMRHEAAPGLPRREGERPVHEMEDTVNAALIALGKKMGIKVIATNDVHFLNAADAEAHDILLCLSMGKKVSDPNRLHYTRQEWFKTYEEMDANLPGCAEQLANTLEIADKVESYLIDSAPIMPVFPIPESFGREADYATVTEETLRAEFGKRYDKLAVDGIDRVRRIKFESDYLRALTMDGAKVRWPKGISEEVQTRIDFELDTIKTMGFPGYFLIVSDFIAAAREMGVFVGPGRGSAAGSVVAYCLKITNINPMQYDLLFERFLNPDRISMPDIDIDFDDDGRQRVLEWVTQKYGTDHVAHIVTFGQMAPKSAIKDVARVMDVPIPESTRLAGLVPNTPKITMDKAKVASPELAGEFNSPNPVTRKVLELASKLDGSIRQPGVHACGVIISRDPLTETIPVMPTEKESLLTTQYDGHFVENIGLLKMDFLGLKTLTVLKECLVSIKETTGKEIDLDEVPLEDRGTFELFSRGDTTGLFQFESEGMKNYLRALKPTRLEDLVAMNALYRPGPMQYIPQFVARKHGREPIVYDHPLMMDTLKSTYGVTVYQEQVMLLSHVLGNFTRGESDSLRKAMGKKNIALMETYKEKFVDGCLANKAFMAAPVCATDSGARKLIDKIWSDWQHFAEYAFNKSHAVCYAYVAYLTGYMKAHYPAEFMCAQISSEIGNFEKLPSFVIEAGDMGLQVLPPDVNFSMARFSPGDGNIRYGLAGVKGVGKPAAEAIVSERLAHGPYKSLFDFCSRLGTMTNKRVLEALVRCGALDGFGMHRARLFAGIETALKRAASAEKERASGQTNLFDLLDAATPEAATEGEDLPDCPHWPEKDCLAGERELLGLYMTGHPLAQYRRIVDDFRTFRFAQLGSVGDETRDVRVAGMLDAATLRMTRPDPAHPEKLPSPWAILSLDDGDITAEVLAFPSTYKKFEWVTGSVDSPILVCGTVSRRRMPGVDPAEAPVQIVAQEIFPLTEVPRAFARYVTITIDAPAQEIATRIATLKSHVQAYPGVLPVRLAVRSNDKRTVIIATDASWNVDPTLEFIAAMTSFVGVKNFHFTSIPDIYKNSKPRRRWEG